MVNELKMKNIEQITVTVTITHGRRGDVKMVLISPNNIESVLLSGRPSDDDTTGFTNWTAMTVAHWFFFFYFREENPVGNWKLKIIDTTPGNIGKFISFRMSFFGQSSVTTIYPTPADSLLFYPRLNTSDIHPIAIEPIRKSTPSTILGNAIVILASLAMAASVLTWITFRLAKGGCLTWLYRYKRAKTEEMQVVETEDELDTLAFDRELLFDASNEDRSR
jgi:subtilisin-like proprotein convertase family protein